MSTCSLRGPVYPADAEAIAGALQAAGGEIKTFNDSPNKTMLGMNEALGFRRTATRTRYRLRLEGEQ
ncbi:hypothetical protein Deipr_2006 [Deinococcus proteolyticus MRP]|uniref:GCN5-related N-acetyltransferase n=1 Tax=Deinococcus proteolyticus (strain ATCC 35074 / DSM 20540 / JCM 6276 / NBRC 101906 / NCIMB 13154 / VKM Ac-1939 / CCM 2703 / MRP) TaxID=693977 RepID=F0RMR9_DEIPM|nr:MULTISPECIES: hypothetical protein [Deinococcus]ADY27137.1 hypothetical protein Deipr_2006 [Deinococcus proteolyticus MRP]MCY1703262.1 hypothetical protein [Deinococcus sp. SL84]